MQKLQSLKLSLCPVFRSFWGSAAASACGDEFRSLVWRRASPAGRARPRSWLWTACTCGTGPAWAHRHSASRARGGTSPAMGLAPPEGCCAGTSCTGGRLRHPSLWCQCRNLLRGQKKTWFEITLKLLTAAFTLPIWMLVLIWLSENTFMQRKLWKKLYFSVIPVQTHILRCWNGSWFSFPADLLWSHYLSTSNSLAPGLNRDKIQIWTQHRRFLGGAFIYDNQGMPAGNKPKEGSHLE